MKQIEFIPIEENNVNDKLANLYGSKLVKFYTKIEELYNSDWYRNKYKLPAAPLLIELEEDDNGNLPYVDAALRIMIFGRETNNWDDRGDTRKNHMRYTKYGTYDFNLQNSDDVLTEIRGKHPDESSMSESFGLTDIYIDYLYRRDDNNRYIRENKTPFTRWNYDLVETLRKYMPTQKIEFVWNNLFKIGKTDEQSGHACGPSNSILRGIENDCFDVINEEVKILKPDILLFAPIDEDKTLMDKFGIDENAFEIIDPDLPELKRIKIPGIKYAARTIHPSRQSNLVKEIYNKALIDDILTHL